MRVAALDRLLEREPHEAREVTPALGAVERVLRRALAQDHLAGSLQRVAEVGPELAALHPAQGVVGRVAAFHSAASPALRRAQHRLLPIAVAGEALGDARFAQTVVLGAVAVHALGPGALLLDAGAEGQLRSGRPREAEVVVDAAQRPERVAREVTVVHVEHAQAEPLAIGTAALDHARPLPQRLLADVLRAHVRLV